MVVILAAAVVGAAQSACDGSDAPATATAEPTATSAPATATAEPTATSDVPAGFHSLGTRTGVPAVDRALEAIARRDQPALSDLAVLVSTTCRKRGSEGRQPECLAGVPEGTQVQAFLGGACEPVFLHDLAEARERVGSLATPQHYVYAVYEGGFGVGGDAAFTVVVSTSTMVGETYRATQVSLDASGRVIGIVTCSHISPELWTHPGLSGDHQLVLPPVGG